MDNYFPNYGGYPPPSKEKKGCRIALAVVGWLLIVAGVLVIGFSVLLSYEGDVAQKDREKASKEYYEKYGDYLELPDSISVSDTTEAALQAIAERDSLLDTIPPPPPVGFNIAAAFGLFFIFIALIPIVIGCVLIFVAYRMKKK
ncbi:MAG: hypothetical protein K5893_09720 [Prevotella sp.]|nr:hypothetical protein [Prevotella sp.]